MMAIVVARYADGVIEVTGWGVIIMVDSVFVGVLGAIVFRGRDK